MKRGIILMDKTQEIVSSLITARKNKQPLLFIDPESFSTEESFYNVQNEYIQRGIEEYHHHVKGYKISLTNKGLQKVFNTNSPVYGTLTENTIIEDGVVSRKDFFDPLLETELMFKITEDISPFADPSEIIEKSLIAPGLEIPDSRIRNWYPKISIGELIMDNAVTGRIVAGTPKKLNSSIKLDEIAVTLFLNDEEVAHGQSNFVLDNPLNAVLWLNNMLSAQGKTLLKGMIISSGTFIAPIPLTIGTYRACFDYFGEVNLNVYE
jgi:2-keto-4-pentenoate hydratase